MLLHPLFRDLPEDRRRELARVARMVMLKKGDVLVSANEVCRDVFLVLSGKLRVDTGGPDATNAATGFLVTNDIYTENFVDDTYTLQSTLVAVLNSTVQAFPLPTIAKLFRDYPNLLMQTFEVVNLRMQGLRKQLRRLANSPPEIVIGRALYELADADASGRRVLSKRITQGILANYVGMSREEVNRKMRELEQKGLIRRVEDGFELDSSFAQTNLLAQRA
jgi:CRP/FNR family transcriptional regulator, cyclic AMP receptor protein